VMVSARRLCVTFVPSLGYFVGRGVRWLYKMATNN
jgi:hypothetical protein